MCRAEAPEVEQFARDHQEDLQLIGMGSQDSLELAESFVANEEMTAFPMLWDPGFDSWTAFRVRGQPAAVLMNPEGVAVKGWIGRIPEEEVLQLVAQMS